MLALLAIAAVAIGGVVGLALSSGGNGNANAKRASSNGHTATDAARPSTGARTVPGAAAASSNGAASSGPAPTPTATKPSSAGGTSDPTAANDRGFRLIQSQDYAGAVAPLRAAVQGFRDAGRTHELGYYFALYNLGVALNRSGDPGAAIPYLQERLRNPNQRATVERELASAKAKAKAGGN